jgi:hypothetical protein
MLSPDSTENACKRNTLCALQIAPAVILAMAIFCRSLVDLDMCKSDMPGSQGLTMIVKRA